MTSSSRLPRILVVDDIFGSSVSDRRNFCVNFGLLDTTGDDANPLVIVDPIAEAVFSSGQRRENGFVQNDTSSVVEIIRGSWTGKEPDPWALILLDLRFASGKLNNDGEPEGREGDDTFGLFILREITDRFPDLPVVVQSVRDRADVIEDCRKHGAVDFMQRHDYSRRAETPRGLLQSKLYEHGLIRDHRNIIVGGSVALLKVLRSARRAATGRGNILILGETGTGKELLARYVHDVSPKFNGPYHIYHPHESEGLQEDALFGHEKGAFTGAIMSKPGIFELSQNGTLFIDEVGEISENLQSKLLRPLENKVIARQGSTREVELDIQVVLATNKNLDEYVHTGRFKLDLLNRINASTIRIPSLRERQEDMAELSRRLLELHCSDIGATWPRHIDAETMHVLMAYAWPGNVRELSNVLRNAVNNNKGSELLIPSDLHIGMPATSTTGDASSAMEAKRVGKVGGDIAQLIEAINRFEFPRDYSELNGMLPHLQRAFAELLTRYLAAALEVTRRMKPGQGDNGEVNMTGAVSCIMGEQLKTPKAADMVKKILRSNSQVLENVMEENPALKQVYVDALRLRPKNPK